MTVFAALAAQAQSGLIVTVAGKPSVRGATGDGGPAAAAGLELANMQNDCDPLRFEQTSHISVDAAGNLYIADADRHRIRRIAPSGIITTVAGSGEKPDTNSRCEPTSPPIDAGSALVGRLFSPGKAVAGANGSLIIADTQNNRIRLVNAAGNISTIAGNGTHNVYAPGVPALSSPMDWISAVAIGPGGLVAFAELHGNRVGRIAADGRLETLAGTGFPGFNGDRIRATTAQLRKPTGIVFDAAGNLYIADSGNHRIRKVDSQGIITTVAGTGVAGFAGDQGPATSAQLDTPMDMAVDSQGNLYIADTANHRIRKVDASGTITTVAGTGEGGAGRELVAATTSPLNFPSSVAVDARDDLYIADWQNFTIRKVIFGPRPLIVPGGAVNSASFEAFPAPVAPGSIITIFGANLGATAIASGAPWQRELGGTSVEVNGTKIPLYVVSPSQISGQLPYGLTEGMTALAVPGSNVIAVNIGATAPGLFLLPGGRSAALNQDGVTVNSAEAPELRGNVVTVFLTGQGEVTPSVAAGEVAPSGVLSRPAAGASATIGGATAEILFLGLTPGSIGLAQANLRIPTSIEAGDRDVRIEIGGRTSNVARIAVR